MASSEGNIVGRLQKHTECSMCMTTFTDPRILPCEHTFCLKCLENTAANTKKRPGKRMPCPYCRKIFTIPPNGFTGLMINDNVNSLITKANDAIIKSTVTNVCDRHKTKTLEAFCLECEQPVCISCLIDNHQGHKASDIVEVKERFSLELADYMKRMSSNKEKGLHLIKEQDEKKDRYLKEIEDKKSAILKRSKELVDCIERNTRSLLRELSLLEAQHLAEMEKEREELEKQCVIMENYQTIYEATVAKASLVDICGTKKELQIVVESMDEWLKSSKVASFEVLLQLHDKIEIDLKSEAKNVVGRIKETGKDNSELIPLKEKKVFVVGSYDRNLDDTIITMFEFNLSRPNEISEFQPVPTEMQSTAVAVSFDDKILLIGMGKDSNEIWKFERISGWKHCADLDRGRERHRANVVDTLIYICGGYDPIANQSLKSVEAYDLQTNKCSTVGELIAPVWYSTSVAYKWLIYIFDSDHVQIFDTRDNSCSVIFKPMPYPQYVTQALTWNSSVILLNHETCFIFDLEKETWREVEDLKTDVTDFGLVHDEEKVYIFGGTKTGCVHMGPILTKTDKIKCVLLDDIITCKDVEWQFQGRLPKPTEIDAYA